MAVNHYQNRQKVYTLEKHPKFWADSEKEIADVYYYLGKHNMIESYLEKAIDSYNKAFQIYQNMNLKDHVLKPTFASAIMGVIVYIIYKVIVGALGNAISTIIAICAGILVYLVLVLGMKMLTKEDIYMIPFGTKIYSLLVKLKVYKEN